MYKKLHLVVLVFATLAVNFSGCHRGYYRRQADKEAESLIREKQNDSRWNHPDASIDTHHMSRMHDQFSADHPPMPMDDPASHCFMEQVDGKPGYPHWNANLNTQYVENPEWMRYLPVNNDGYVILDMSNSVTMGLIHSPDYQRQRETLYLSALDVSLDRVGFDSQLSATWNSFFQTDGRFRSGSSQSLWQVGAPGTGMQLRKLGITGSTLVVGLANSLVWNFSGPNTQTASTLLDFSIIQPLLRGAGRDRIMESLTQAERTLLANVRQMERFRRGFYLQVTTGRNPGAGPNRGGNFLGTPSGANAGAGGILGLLSDKQSIRIQESNVASLRNVVSQFYAFKEADAVNLLLVRQAESRLYAAQRGLMQSRTNYDARLDGFKQTLGLPPNLPVKIQDAYLNQFDLIDDDLIKKQNEISTLQDGIGGILTEAEEKIESGDVVRDPVTNEISEFTYTDEIGKKIAELKPLLESVNLIHKKLVEETIPKIEKDIDRQEAARPGRLEYLKKLKSNVEKRYEETGKLDIELSILNDDAIEDPAKLRENLNDTKEKLDGVLGELGAISTLIDKLANQGKDLTPKELYDSWELLVRGFPQQMSQISGSAIELSLLQALARTDTIGLVETDMTPDVAFEIARAFRRDWMNARASLVDQWRQIEFAADDLESQLDLVFEGDIGNTGDNPFRIRYETGSLRAGFRFDAPLTRLTERNRYRETLINYQQSKRNYYLFQDAVSQNLRQTLRLIELQKILFELSRRSIKTAVQSVEIAQFELVNPENRTLGPNASRNLTDALSDLQVTQTDFLDTWVRYEVLRRGLDFDLGTMQLTPDGFWVDPGPITPEIAYKAAMALGLDPSSIMDLENRSVMPAIPDDLQFDRAPGGNQGEFGNPEMNPPSNMPQSQLLPGQSGPVQIQPIRPPLQQIFMGSNRTPSDRPQSRQSSRFSLQDMR